VIGISIRTNSQWILCKDKEPTDDVYNCIDSISSKLHGNDNEVEPDYSYMVTLDEYDGSNLINTVHHAHKIHVGNVVVIAVDAQVKSVVIYVVIKFEDSIGVGDDGDSIYNNTGVVNGEDQPENIGVAASCVPLIMGIGGLEVEYRSNIIDRLIHEVTESSQII